MSVGEYLLFPCCLFHPFEELLLQLSGKLVVGVDLQGFLIVLHHIDIVSLTVLGRILHDAHHIEESAQGADVRLVGTFHLFHSVDGLLGYLTVHQFLFRLLHVLDDFIQGLLVHLEPALYRMKNDMTIYNPLLDEIKNEYPDMFESCEKAAKVITERTGIVPGEAEIGYLVMHFGAAREKIESRKKKKRIVNAGVICASGFGVARLMLAKLKSKFSDKEVVFHAFGSDEISQHVTSKIDFFISSINVDTLHVDYVMVSPLITQKDIVQISVKIGEYALMPARQENTPRQCA